MGKVKQKALAPRGQTKHKNTIDSNAKCFASEVTQFSFDAAAADFGGFVHNRPSAVAYPTSPEDIATIIKAATSGTSRLTVAARGNGHSIHGQAQAHNGIVIDMNKMPNGGISVVAVPGEQAYVEASAGELWIDVLKESLRWGFTPKSWTDYLYLSVGGTLSNAGVSGQTFKHGPQISNVLQLQVVTGNGEIVTCSPIKNSDLFFGVLGGLGQFGIITRARIALEQAHQRARYMRLLYKDFEAFRKDIEFLISQPDDEDAVNYVEGTVVPNTDDPFQGYKCVPFPGQSLNLSLIPSTTSAPVLYCIEIAKYYDDCDILFIEEYLKRTLNSLSNIQSLVFTIDLSYLEFLNRVRVVEDSLRKIHRWDVPHPWLIMFVPKSNITKLNELVLKKILSKGVNGPMLVYPLNKSKWDDRTSAVTPDENIFYMVGLLRYVLPSGSSLEAHLQQNEEILKISEAAGLGIKQYFPHYTSEVEWKNHFGSLWPSFINNKLKFDPHSVLNPGQNIFPRNLLITS